MPKSKSPIPVKDEALWSRALLLTLNKRLGSVAVVEGLAIVFLGLAILTMLPLKQTKPYIVEVAKDTGAAYVPKQAEAVAYNPAFDTIKYFVTRWVSDAFTINQYSTVKTLDPRARLMLRGTNAIAAYKDWLTKDGKFAQMAAHPQMTRDVQVVSVTPIAGTKNGVVVDLRLLTRINGEQKEQKRLVTLYYEFFHPDSRSDVEADPIGLYITDFKVSGDE